MKVVRRLGISRSFGSMAEIVKDDRSFGASGGASGSRMDREVLRPLSVLVKVRGSSSRHRPGQA
jgi:hypothetical protein